MSNNAVEPWVFTGTQEAAVKLMNQLPWGVRDLTNLFFHSGRGDLLVLQKALSECGCSGAIYAGVTLLWADYELKARQPSQAVPSTTEDTK